MRKQYRTSIGPTMVELVPDSPRRTGLWVQNVENVIFSIYARQDNPYGGIYLYPGCWLFFDRSVDCHKQWWVQTTGGTKAIRIIEFYEE